MKDTMVLSDWKFDLCNKSKEFPDLFKLTIGFLGIPLDSSCSSKAASIHCYHQNKIGECSKATKRLLSYFATVSSGVSTKVNISHDTGNSCFKMQHKVLKVHQKLTVKPDTR